MLSKLKSGVAPEEPTQRVTRQMTVTALDSRNPLHIPEILENVLEYIPVEDLKSCRLVNNSWKDSALKPMKKISAQITFGNYQGCHDLKDMETFLQCFTVANSSGSGSTSGEDREFQVGIPCTRFKLYTDILNEQSSDRDKSIVASFLQTISHCATEIVLENKGKIFDQFLQGLVGLKFPNLRKSIFNSYIGTGVGTEIKETGAWMSVFIKNSPRLEKICFWAYRAIPGNTRDPWTPIFFDVLQENHGMNITDLTIAAELENEDVLKLKSSCGLKLEYFNLLVYNSWRNEQLKAVSEFMERQCETLKRLMILNPFEYPLQASVLPRMKNLTSLVFQWGSSGVVNYREQFPALRNIVFHQLNPNNWSQYLQPEMEPTETVVGLSLWRSDTTVEAILEAVRIFPRVLHLTMGAFPLGLPIVYDSCWNLQELSLYTKEDTCIDRMLTGLDEDGYEEALDRMRNWTPNFDATGIRIGFEHSPISKLTNLKVLKLDAQLQRGRQLEITKVSICLALMKMPSLKILDLGLRMRSPELSIPSRVLKEFRKNRLILYEVKDIRRRSPPQVS